MEALRVETESRSLRELGQKLKEIHDRDGIKYQSISEATGINRSPINTLALNGTASLKPESAARLWAWVDEWERSQGLAPAAMTVSNAEGGCKTTQEIILTKDLVGALGFCDFCIKHREIGVVMGMPGTGKTTVVQIVSGKQAHAIHIEAWLSMRLADLLDEIGAGLGLQVNGTINSRTQKIIRALKQQPDTVILVDEAEYLKKWNVEKLDVLRKLHDNAGVAILLFGTPAIANVLNRRDTTQLSRRMFQYSFSGARKDEIRQALRGYNMDESVVERLAAMAADTAHGGMGTYTKMLELCLYAAQGGRITMETLQEAAMYKPGL